MGPLFSLLLASSINSWPFLFGTLFPRHVTSPAAFDSPGKDSKRTLPALTFI